MEALECENVFFALLFVISSFTIYSFCFHFRFCLLVTLQHYWMNSSGIHSFGLQYVPALFVVQGGKVLAQFDGRQRPVGVNAQGHPAADWCVEDLMKILSQAHSYNATGNRTGT